LSSSTERKRKHISLTDGDFADSTIALMAMLMMPLPSPGVVVPEKKQSDNLYHKADNL